MARACPQGRGGCCAPVLVRVPRPAPGARGGGAACGVRGLRAPMPWAPVFEAAPPRTSPPWEGTRPRPAPSPEPESLVVVPGARSTWGGTDGPREAAQTSRCDPEPPRAGSAAPAGLAAGPPCALRGARSGSAVPGHEGPLPLHSPDRAVSPAWFRALIPLQPRPLRPQSRLTDVRLRSGFNTRF